MNAAAATLPFSKYHGLGNDFVLVDARSGDAPPMTPAEAEAMCDRNFGVGADGVIFVLPPTAVQGGSADQQLKAVAASGAHTSRRVVVIPRATVLAAAHWHMLLGGCTRSSGVTSDGMSVFLARTHTVWRRVSTARPWGPCC